MVISNDRPPLIPEAAPAGVSMFRGRAGEACFAAARAILAAAQPRHYETAWGRRMSVAMTNCGRLGWYSDRAGYRYTAEDPVTGRNWPPIPEILYRLAVEAAGEAGFDGFAPEACLVNLYDGSARMGMHQDRNELALDQPVVSISFGRSAIFRFGGLTRQSPSRNTVLDHGDIVVFGGPSRLCFHGITRLTGPPHGEIGDFRINLTFRRVTKTS